MPHANYPASVVEVLDDAIRYKPATLRAVRRFARSKPWRGTLAERQEKFRRLHAELCRLYWKRTALLFCIDEPEAAHGNGYFTLPQDAIVLLGKLSVVTYLHEFAHAVFGPCERQVCRWSLNLFRRVFPRSYNRCAHVGHTLRTTPNRSKHDAIQRAG